MNIKPADFYKDMDKLIDTYALLGKDVKILRLTPDQWQCMSRDWEKAVKKNIHSHPVTSVDGKPTYKGYTLVRHAQ